MECQVMIIRLYSYLSSKRMFKYSYSFGSSTASCYATPHDSGISLASTLGPRALYRHASLWAKSLQCLEERAPFRRTKADYHETMELFNRMSKS